ncbi:5-oxoprolinase subunit PxpB [Vogesella facilis]|uniref:5-oxoprolinase subunit PxpB n=1 Tax=Vogesella facilis TaxID=1655232 RepID=A0ABV7RII4_9NEIS
MTHAAIHCQLLGERAVVLSSPPPATLACQRRIWWLADTLRAQGGFVDIVPAMNNLTVLLDPARHDAQAVQQLLLTLWQQAGNAAPPQRRVDIPVRYGGEHGPDLAAVAAHCGLSPQEVIARHSAARYTVFFLGFQPGFAYLGGLPPALATPRRAEPRLTVPAGSVGIGGAQTGIYPAASPGGWQLIGHTDLTLFDPQREPPSLLLPGDRVRFQPLEHTHA